MIILYRAWLLNIRISTCFNIKAMNYYLRICVNQQIPAPLNTLMIIKGLALM